MNDKNISIVITTVNRPVVLEALADNFRSHQRLDNVNVIIVGDRKTPVNTADYVESVCKKTGLSAKYWSIDEQLIWLNKFPRLSEIIPFDSDNRRNIGHLMAYESGADIIVALDDDNYPLNNSDYILPFLEVGEIKKYPVISSDTGWYNVCRSLISDCSFEFFPRGFPYSKRANTETEPAQQSVNSGLYRLIIKAGLWLGDPDVDAVTRLAYPISVTGYKGDDIYLSPETLCPVNTQNTAFHRDLLPAFYYVHMDRWIDGQKIDRYGDIWSGIFAQKIMHHMGDIVGFGQPLVNHDRNQHDLLKDLGQEYPGMVLTNKLITILDDIQLAGDTYCAATQSFANALKAAVNNDDYLTDGEMSYLLEVADNISIWLDAVSRIDG